MDRLAIARLLHEIGLLLEAQGGNPFKARAYERGARALEALTADLEPLIAQNRLTEIPGIGPALAGTIRELRQTGRSELLERLRAELPPGVLELSQVPGLSVPRIAALHQALGIASVKDLQAAVEAGRVRGVRGLRPEDGGFAPGRPRPARGAGSADAPPPRDVGRRAALGTRPVGRGRRAGGARRRASPAHGDGRPPGGRHRRRRSGAGPRPRGPVFAGARAPGAHGEPRDVPRLRWPARRGRGRGAGGVPGRPPRAHRLGGPSRATRRAGEVARPRAGPRGARPGQGRVPTTARHRGGALPDAGAPLPAPGGARRRGRPRDGGRPVRRRRAGPGVGHPGDGALPHDLLGWRRHGRGHGPRGPGDGHAVHHHHRPLADRVVRGRPAAGPAPAPVGRDREGPGAGDRG